MFSNRLGFRDSRNKDFLSTPVDSLADIRNAADLRSEGDADMVFSDHVNC